MARCRQKKTEGRINRWSYWIT